MILVLSPSKAFAENYTLSTVNKLYFEDYKTRIKEVKDAQKLLKNGSCNDVILLSKKSQASTENYKKLVKSKASKATLASAKALRDQDKKALSAARKVCSKKINEAKRESNARLKELDNYKNELAKMILNHLKERDQLSQDSFNKQVYGGLTYIDETFTSITQSLKTIN